MKYRERLASERGAIQAEAEVPATLSLYPPTLLRAFSPFSFEIFLKEKFCGVVSMSLIGLIV